MLAVGTSSGAIFLVSLTTLQACPCWRTVLRLHAVSNSGWLPHITLIPFSGVRHVLRAETLPIKPSSAATAAIKMCLLGHTPHLFNTVVPRARHCNHGDLAAWQVHARLVGGHKTAVTALVTLSAREPGAPDALISASVDGTVAVWHPSTSSVKLPDKEVAPKTTFKAHDGEILSAALIASPVDSPEAGQLNLVTAGGSWMTSCWRLCLKCMFC